MDYETSVQSVMTTSEGACVLCIFTYKHFHILSSCHNFVYSCCYLSISLKKPTNCMHFQRDTLVCGFEASDKMEFAIMDNGRKWNQHFQAHIENNFFSIALFIYVCLFLFQKDFLSKEKFLSSGNTF